MVYTGGETEGTIMIYYTGGNRGNHNGILYRGKQREP